MVSIVCNIKSLSEASRVRLLLRLREVKPPCTSQFFLKINLVIGNSIKYVFLLYKYKKAVWKKS